MGKSKIEWCDRVWNPVTGCTKVSPGCEHCYAERMSKRFGEKWGLPADNPFKVMTHSDRLDQPLHWTKPSKVFVCSMSDLFHDDVPDKFIIDVLSVIAEAHTHTFLILTKRPERMLEMLSYKNVANDVWLQTSRGVDDEKSPWPLDNLWLGVTAENQEQAKQRIPILLQIPAAKRFVSVEPMLGPVKLSRYLKWPICEHWRPDEGGNPNEYGKYHWEKQSLVARGWVGLDWVICGGESGPGARPMHPDWVRSLRDQCKAAGTPFLFKQWGEWVQVEGSGACEPTPICYWNEEIEDWKSGLATHTQNMVRVGKKKAGRLIDDQLWDQYPVQEV
ncbi:protein gp37 [Sporomusaceae bacterium BoRhaA]|uniref:DUF5131 family protein n=1 Tax=Pelorhabdus rhamnosifermentans TaxID=2772457 RepID=UPI001C06049E|nr:phage Gp37/Gp68 family protein [Pelorhabdus rhamnosifermentans]MBU2701128.1 protein gp37 [Pelorhabdus rhamnosifermentans]